MRRIMTVNVLKDPFPWLYVKRTTIPTESYYVDEIWKRNGYSA